jgi:hypothetical protein
LTAGVAARRIALDFSVGSVNAFHFSVWGMGTLAFSFAAAAAFSLGSDVVAGIMTPCCR